MHSKEIFPSFHLLENSTQTVSFSGVSSNGLPTNKGWFDLMTGVLPGRYTNDIVSEKENDADMIFSWFRQQGYQTYVVSISPIRLDAFDNWMLRGKPVNRKIGKKLRERIATFPLEFDRFYEYSPTAEQAAELGVTQQKYINSINYIPDRITVK